MKFFALLKKGKILANSPRHKAVIFVKDLMTFSRRCLRTGEYFRACSQSRRPSSDNVQDGGPAFISRKVLLISVSTVSVILTQLDS